MLGYSQYQVNRLCQLGKDFGGLDAHKLPSVRGNAHWNIDWESVINYKAQRGLADRELLRSQR